uniref:NADH-ubiquinone oxidoreductase chain 6 n=1 Tax=Poecilimon luschani TaxID=473713 RepID=A0A4D6DHS2_9ORTH|nr:NADH dehydrogenase subunit 6 [Poecilimon luschani]QBZ37728.1 NADH dehydrogenase subunit 6 [Poecilimon luschani]
MQFTFIPSLFITLIFLLTSHPLAMTLTIIIQTLLICLTVSSLTQTFWFSYILFLVFLGGMLVLFIYITSLAANEMFSSMTKATLFILSFLGSLFLINMFLDPSLLSNLSYNSEMQELNFQYLSYSESNYLLTKLYNTPTKFLTLMLVSYLFFTLIAVVKITNIFLGPLRQKH